MPSKHDYFSLDEANALLPTLEYYFRLLALCQRDLAGIRLMLEAGGATIGAGGVRLPRPAATELKRSKERYGRLCAEYDHLIGEILHMGVEVVDPEVGLVNFYTWVDGEEVVLSWQYGEPAVQYWFDPGEQFGERRPLRQLFGDAPGGAAVRH
ncbi:MAG: DUF2203 family protein [Deltaproteobacteria bacterium]|nr:DUF2203 family protein [Deltaproteobacteria bacterium]